MSEADSQPMGDQHRPSADPKPIDFGRILAYFLKLGAIGFGFVRRIRAFWWPFDLPTVYQLFMKSR